MMTIDRTKMSGIYLIENVRDGKVWVGQAGEFAKRWQQHRKNFEKNKNSPHLQRAWKKCGESAFRFEILEVCKKDRDILNQREQFWMDFFLSYDPRFGYNIAPVAGSNRGLKASEKTRKRISEAKKGTQAGENHPMYGKHPSDESRKKMSESHKGLQAGRNHYNYGKRLSEETKKKLSENHYDVAGEKNPSAKLTWKNVEEIRQKYVPKSYSLNMLAKEYMVSKAVILKIIHNESWIKKVGVS